MMRRLITLFAMLVLVASAASAQEVDLDALKDQVVVEVEARQKLVQEIVDSLFSFAEPAFQEFETKRYLTDILGKQGFEIEIGTGGMPTAWVATWSNGSGKPAISLNTDVDNLLGLSQTPGVTTHQPQIEGGPGHGEGHNTGMGGVVVAALVLKDIMERENISGTIQVWPGVAEEILAGKAHFVRAGIFDDIDVVLSTHVGNTLSTSYGRGGDTGMVSVLYSFEGETAHAGSSPWLGRSALDAVELMNAGINFRREHFRPQSRTHYVITSGGEQPNIVPDYAEVWYYFRETDAARIIENFEVGNRIAEGAALMTDTKVSRRVIGSAWPSHGNKPVAEAMHTNIERVGMPDWSEADQAFANLVQSALGAEPVGLPSEVGNLGLPVANPSGGYSDDIGDVMWTVPTVRLSYPSNIRGTIGHHWTAALASATPIAHKGATQSAKVLAMTALDLYLEPDLVKQAWDYFLNVHTKEVQYVSFLGPDDEPPIDVNDAIMEKYRPLQEPLYYDPTQYDTYLEQLGIDYPGN